MKEENNNNMNEQQTKNEEIQKVIAIYNKIVAVADKITDDYNDDPEMLPNHVLLGIGIFLRRMESSLNDEDAVRKNGRPWGEQTPRPTDKPTLADVLDVIQKGYEIGKMTECQIPEEPEQTSGQEASCTHDESLKENEDK